MKTTKDTTRAVPTVRIDSGAGRHGRAWRVSLVGLNGYELVSWTRSSYEDALSSALDEFGALPMKKNGENTK